MSVEQALLSVRTTAAWPLRVRAGHRPVAAFSQMSAQEVRIGLGLDSRETNISGIATAHGAALRADSISNSCDAYDSTTCFDCFNYRHPCATIAISVPAVNGVRCI